MHLEPFHAAKPKGKSKFAGSTAVPARARPSRTQGQTKHQSCYPPDHKHKTRHYGGLFGDSLQRSATMPRHDNKEARNYIPRSHSASRASLLVRRPLDARYMHPSGHGKGLKSPKGPHPRGLVQGGFEELGAKWPSSGKPMALSFCQCGLGAYECVFS